LKRILDLAVIDKLILENPAAPIKPRKPSDDTAITQTLASADEDDQADGIAKCGLRAKRTVTDGATTIT
jgi:hypothetical protein